MKNMKNMKNMKHSDDQDCRNAFAKRWGSELLQKYDVRSNLLEKERLKNAIKEAYIEEDKQEKL